MTNNLKRDRLGKGLTALLGEYLGDAASVPEGASTRQVLVAKVGPNPFQPRREFKEEELAELASSIRENGLLQPVVVRRAPEGSGLDWELVAGERRWRAVTRLGWQEVPAVVRDVDDRTMLVLAMVENLQRSSLSPLEEADGYHRLSEEFGLTQQQIAEIMGRDRSTVANALRLLQLPASVRRLLADGSLSAGHARALLGVHGDHRMGELARRAAEEGWSVREVEAEVQRVRPARKSRTPAAPKPRDAAEREIEEALQRALGTAVRIKHARGGRGRIEIPFYNADDFERVYELLVGAPVSDVVS
ncbi:MAG TPA: ParB/RepB/Spo0J family partition protein [Longimicrobiales bacterium]